MRQKIDQVVRRKSTEDSMKAAANKVSSSIKRTLSATDVTKSKISRRVSEDITRNGDMEKPQPPIKLNIKEPDSSTDSILPIKKIKTEVSDKNETDEEKGGENSDGEILKKISPIKYPFRYASYSNI